MSEIERLREALAVANTAINDWTCQYASDMVGDEALAGARERINNAGGTLGYICDVQKTIHDALSYKHPDHIAGVGNMIPSQNRDDICRSCLGGGKDLVRGIKVMKPGKDLTYVCAECGGSGKSSKTRGDNE